MWPFRVIPGFHISLLKKQNKYVDLKIELSQLWHSRVCIMPIIVGALWSVPMNLSSMLEKLNISTSVISTFQRSVLHSTAAIVRRHMNIWLNILYICSNLRSWFEPRYFFQCLYCVLSIIILRWRFSGIPRFQQNVESYIKNCLMLQECLW